MNVSLVFILIVCTIQNGTFSKEQDVIPFVNEKLQRYINNLFYNLKIDTNFGRSYKVKMLLMMYENLNNAIALNWKIYSNVKNSVAVSDNITDNLLFNLVKEALSSDTVDNTTITEETIIEDKYSSDEDEDRKLLRDNMSMTTETALNTNILSDEIVVKMNNFSVDDLIDETMNKTYLEINEETRYKLLGRRNTDLETWYSGKTNDATVYRRASNAELCERYSFVASVHVLNKFACTGAIISAHAVITAASCFPLSYNTKKIQQMSDVISVRVGSDYANSFGEMVQAMDVEIHPQYEAKTMKNNLAIIRLKLHKSGNNRSNIRRIRIDEKDTKQSPVSSVLLLGFGAGSGDLQMYNQLAAANLSMIPLKECIAVYSSKFVSAKNFCAGILTRRSTSGCNVDVGGPAVSDGLLLGIVSFGPRVCDSGNAPTVFVKLQDYATWINLVTNQKWKKSIVTPVQGQQLKTSPIYNVDPARFKEVKDILRNLYGPKARNKVYLMKGMESYITPKNKKNPSKLNFGEIKANAGIKTVKYSKTPKTDSIRNRNENKQKRQTSSQTTRSSGFDIKSTRIYYYEESDIESTQSLDNNQKHNILNDVKSILHHLYIPSTSKVYEEYPISKKVYPSTKRIRNKLHPAKNKHKDEDPFKYMYEETKVTKVHQHPLYNKSILQVPNVHYTPIPTTKRTASTKFSRPDIGLPDGLPYHYIDQNIKDSDELDYFVKLLLSRQGPLGRTESIKRTKTRHKHSTKALFSDDDYSSYTD